MLYLYRNRLERGPLWKSGCMRVTVVTYMLPGMRVLRKAVSMAKSMLDVASPDAKLAPSAVEITSYETICRNSSFHQEYTQDAYHSYPAHDLRDQFSYLWHQLRNAEWLRDDFVHPSRNRRIDLLAPRIRRDGNDWNMPQDFAAQLFFANVSNAGQAVHCWHLQIQEDNRQGCW